MPGGHCAFVPNIASPCVSEAAQEKPQTDDTIKRKVKKK
jgi:hypothetical protein